MEAPRRAEWAICFRLQVASPRQAHGRAWWVFHVLRRAEDWDACTPTNVPGAEPRVSNPAIRGAPATTNPSPAQTNFGLEGAPSAAQVLPPAHPGRRRLPPGRHLGRASTSVSRFTPAEDPPPAERWDLPPKEALPVARPLLARGCRCSLSLCASGSLPGCPAPVARSPLPADGVPPASAASPPCAAPPRLRGPCCTVRCANPACAARVPPPTAHHRLPRPSRARPRRLLWPRVSHPPNRPRPRQRPGTPRRPASLLAPGAHGKPRSVSRFTPGARGSSAAY